MVERLWRRFSISRFVKLQPARLVRAVGGGGGTPLQEANRDMPPDGVAFSRLE